MRICDRRQKTPIALILLMPKTEEEVELCSSCATEFNDWRLSPEQEKKKPGRPKKDGTQ